MNLMIDSIRAGLWGHGALVSICVLAISLAFLILRKEVEPKWINLVFLSCALWSILVVLAYPPRGTNYDIYTHNASLTLSGKPDFGREASPEDSQYILHKDPRYLDYTGMQHLLYVGLTFLDLSSIHPSMTGFGFQLWSIICLLGTLLLIRYGKGSGTGDSLIQKAFAATILAFHPTVVLFWLVYSWEDKIIFLVLPLLLAFLLDRGSFLLSALLIGLAVGLNGLFIFLVPAFLLHVFRAQGMRTWLILGLLCLALVISMLPFFPESLSAWANRIARMNSPKPFWFSVYLLLPDGIYTPTLDKVIVAVLAIASTLAYWMKRLDMRDMIVITTCLVVMLGPFNAVARVLPLIMLIAVFTPCKSRWYWFAFSAVLPLLLLVGRGLSPSNITPVHVVVFHIPFVWVLGLYAYHRIRLSRPSRCDVGPSMA